MAATPHFAHNSFSKLHGFVNEVQELTTSVQTRFGGLSEQELNWQPEPNRWSIAQCLHHLITTNSVYFPKFHAVQSGTYTSTAWQRIPFVPQFFGSILVKAIGRVPNRRFKTSAMFEPSRSTIGRGIVEGFCMHQQRVIEYLHYFDTIDTDNIIIASPTSSLFIFPLTDALTMLVNHEFRHVLQAENVMKLVNFGIV